MQNMFAFSSKFHVQNEVNFHQPLNGTDDAKGDGQGFPLDDQENLADILSAAEDNHDGMVDPVILKFIDHRLHWFRYLKYTRAHKYTGLPSVKTGVQIQQRDGNSSKISRSDQNCQNYILYKQAC